MSVERFSVPGRFDKALGGAALAAPLLDVLGRVLAPSLLLVCPLAVVAISPTDPHLLLARFDPRAVLVAVVFAARCGRAWIIYESIRRGAFRFRSDRLRRLVLPSGREPRGRIGAIVAIVLLPDMLAAVVGGRSGLRARDFAPALVVSTAGGLAITLIAASRFAPQLHAVSTFVTSHPVAATGIVIALIAFGLVRRLRRITPSVDEENACVAERSESQ